ncbi:MAG: ABC transporter ATP-binding protein [Rhodospirillales bacterium]|nr:ABC transporter ATP-binding protein [Rhodospirillales bacterium]MDE2197677.1 ABC transporter ATP-binding protein [Rhodospirillales bacterium]MDE2576052.1 ABC transporter ATP-binding protein [Rhodospirillales bacterium]
MTSLSLDGLRREYGATVAVDRVDLEMQQGELVALLGPSGCGKTTTLRMVAGFVAPTSGRVVIGGRDVTAAPPYARDTGMVFQGYALFPHMSVAENVGFGLEMRRVPRAERGARIAEALRLVRLEGLAERRPAQLSGGQQQRVALARALVVNPAVFLLDEPLSNLDARLRAEVRVEIRALQQRLGLTTLFVTHDQEEALTMADRLVVMQGGRVRQTGTPEEVYERPADLFVAGFIGSCNILRGVVEAPGAFRAGAMALPCAGGAPGERAALVVRPERIAIGPEGRLPGRIDLVTYLGGTTEWHVTTDAGALRVSQKTPDAADPRRLLRRGDGVMLDWRPEAGRLLSDSNEGEQA